VPTAVVTFVRGRAVHYCARMNARSPLGQLLVFILALVLINVVAQLLGLNFRVSIIGSVVLTLVFGLIMGASRRR